MHFHRKASCRAQGRSRRRIATTLRKPDQAVCLSRASEEFGVWGHAGNSQV
jgi:hypothetical protein